MGGIIMTIGEKASEYAEKHFPSDDIHNFGKHDVAFHSYIAGANWMLEKAADWIGDSVVFDKFGRPIDVENFRKAMEV